MRVLVVGASPWRQTRRAIALLALGMVSCATYDQAPTVGKPDLANAAGGAGSGAGSGPTQGGSGSASGGGATAGGAAAGSSGDTSSGGAGGSPTTPDGGTSDGGTPTDSGASGSAQEGDGGQPAEPVVRELASGHAALASSSETGHAAQAGNDGSQSTRWSASSATLPQWWQVDLGASFQLESITVRWEFGNVAYSYSIDVSTNGAEFTPVVVVNAGMGPPQTHQLPIATQARYLRISVTDIVPENWTSIYEVTVHGY